MLCRRPTVSLSSLSRDNLMPANCPFCISCLGKFDPLFHFDLCRASVSRHRPSGHFIPAAVLFLPLAPKVIHLRALSAYALLYNFLTSMRYSALPH